MKICEQKLFQHVMMEANPMLAMLKWITEQLMQIDTDSVDLKADVNNDGVIDENDLDMIKSLWAKKY